MPRRHRIDAVGAIHHVMNRGVARQRTFFDDEDRREFGDRLADIHDRWGIETLAYCLMTNHYHLLVRTPQANLPAAMQHLGLVYTRHTNDRIGRDGPLFRGRYHSIMVTTDRYLLAATRYIHRNALDVRGIEHPADYRWSSYRAYLGHRPEAAFLRTDVVLEHFEHDRARFARFTERTDAAPVERLDDLQQIVELAVARDDLAHGDEQARRWTTRMVMLLLEPRLSSGPLRAAIAAELVFPSAKARSNAQLRAEARAADPALARVLAMVLDEVDPTRRAAQHERYDVYPTLVVPSTLSPP